MKKLLLLLLPLLLFACSKPKNSPQKIDLTSGWEFEYNANWLPAVVPGTIHTDLLRNNCIEDPFFGTNEDSLQWVSRQSWQYRTTFPKESIANHTHAELVFEGLDTDAEIFLNGQPLQHAYGSNKTNNMFRQWNFPLNYDELQESNELLVVFSPTTVLDSIRAKDYHYSLPDIRAFTRKSPYQSGWDWGPNLTTCGIWKPAYINVWNELKINDFQIYQKELNDDYALLEVETEYELSEKEAVNFTYFVNGKEVLHTKTESMSQGVHVFKQEIKIENPKRWYPTGLGEQNLYHVSVKVNTKKDIDTATHQIGLRTIKLVREKDSIGESFEFQVNGVPVFAKGANWIPAEFFTPATTPEKYRTLLEDAKASNMNMIRVWGGGIYEDETFYNICNELGIMVWQDFIFACAFYPSDDSFHQNIAIEAKEQIKRLRNHPSLVLWCGNNEVKNAWEDWGWDKEYTPEQKETVSGNIDKIFNQILRDAVSQYDRGRDYISTSPLWGWGHPESFTEGNAHYWGVWWGEQPFEVWEKATGRFMAEYGFQSYPEMASIAQFTLLKDRNLDSPAMKSHQKHGRGREIITQAINQYYAYNGAKNLDNFVYVSQLVQAYGIGDAIETHRRKMPHCMGTLYWQYNDCWPVASWSSVDYYGNKKALYYASRDKFAPVIISTTPMEKGEVPIYIVSDHLTQQQGDVKMVLMDFSGNILDEVNMPNINLPVNGSQQIDSYRFPAKHKTKSKQLVLVITLSQQGKEITRKIHYFEYPKDLYLSLPQLEYSVKKENGKYYLSYKSNVLVKGLFVFTEDDFGGTYSNNYIDLLPNEEVTIVYTPSPNANENISFMNRNYNVINFRFVPPIIVDYCDDTVLGKDY